MFHGFDFNVNYQKFTTYNVAVLIIFSKQLEDFEYLFYKL